MKLINTISAACAAAVLTSSLSVTPMLQSEQVRTAEVTTSAHDVVLAAQAIYLNGLFGSSIDWRSVTNNGVQVCGPKCPNMAYTALPTQWGLKSGVNLLYKWVTDPARTADDTVNAYSLGTDVALGVLRQLAAEGKTIPKMRWLFFGSPETPGHRATVVGYEGVEGLPAGQFDNVDFVVAKYDLFADPAARFSPLSFMNATATFLVHLFGYNGIDLSKPDYQYVNPVSGVRTLVFKDDILPFLQPLGWIISRKTLLEWSAQLEPVLDADYDRNWQKVQSSAATAEVATVPASVDINAKVSSDQSEPTVDAAPKQETAEASDGGINKQAAVADPPETTQVTDEDATEDVGSTDEVTNQEATQETAAPTKPDTEDEHTDQEVKDADASDGQQADGENASDDKADKESTDATDDKSAKTEDATKDESDSKRETAKSKDDSSTAKTATKDTSSSATNGSKSSDGGDE